MSNSPEEDDAYLDESEGPDEADRDDALDEAIETEPCPYCGGEVAETADICPHCRSFISFEDAPRHYPIWIAIGILLALIGVLTWTLFALAGRII